VPFAKVAVSAQFAANQQRMAVTSVGPFSTSGSGLLARIPRDPTWMSPEIMLWDVAAGKWKSFPLSASDYQVDWERPAPFAEFDNQSFDDVTDFLNYLCVRYGFLATTQPTPLTLKLSRVGSPAPEPDGRGMFLHLQEMAARMLDKSNGDKIATLRNMLVALSSVVPIASSVFGKQTKESQADEFHQVLRRLAQNRKGLSIPKILNALQEWLPGHRENIHVISEQEDWAMAGLAIFVAGVMVYGYRLSAFDEGLDDSNHMIMEINVSLVKS
jgi:hypothetical protein